MRKQIQADFLRDVLKGDEAAVRFVEALGHVSQVLDDLIDGDVPVSHEDIVRAFWDALVAIPSNPFYQEHFAALQPLLRQVFLDWLVANELERGNRDGRALAYVLRDSLVGVVHQCALLVGGYHWAREVGARIRLYFHDEGLEDYLTDRMEADTSEYQERRGRESRSD